MPRYLNKVRDLDFPIVKHLTGISKLFSNHSQLIIQADPGAGKTTILPLSFLDAIPENEKILLLEPRRIAVRNAAQRMAELIGEPVGKCIGYRIRNESKVSKDTRIEVITEGVLTRLIQADPELSGISTIIFDEFHERSIDSDLGLALALEIQENLKENLKLIIMSATLNGLDFSSIMPKAKTFCSEGRSFPVKVKNIPPKTNNNWSQVLISAVQQALTLTQNDLLIFLPGQSEINHAENLLQSSSIELENIEILPLHGRLPFSQQQRALRPNPNRRKIILSTNIAESSVTIQGVDCVIDSGLVRQSVFDPNAGFNRLVTSRISMSSAEQRQGRAGRLGPGICFRLWAESEALRPQSQPEIVRADLANFTLDIAQWGLNDPCELKLLDQPKAGVFAQALGLLQQIEALDRNNRITPHGLQLIKFGIHPRMGHMLIRAIDYKMCDIACVIAAMLDEKDLLSGHAAQQIDFKLRIDAFLNKNIQSKTKKNILVQAEKLMKKISQFISQSKRKDLKKLSELSLSNCAEQASDAKFADLLALAFPDRIAQRRGNGYRLANGVGVTIDPAEDAGASYLVIVALGGIKQSAKIFQAITIELEAIQTLFKSQIEQKEVIEFEKNTQSVKAYEQTRLGELVLTQKPLSDVPAHLVKEGIIEGIKRLGLSQLPWKKTSVSRMNKISMLHYHGLFVDEFPALDFEILTAGINEWLSPFIDGMNKLSQISGEILEEATKAILTWEQQKKLDNLMPDRLQVASGSKLQFDYSEKKQPKLEVKLQEMFGEKESPTVANGKIRVVLHLMSPARRPLQITEDLNSFWESSYTEVKKEMKGRYPKHPWPDDPLTAVATAKTKHFKRR